MKTIFKILLVVIVVLIVIGGFFLYKFYTPNQKELGIVVNQSTIDDLKNQLDIEFPDMEVVNSEKILTPQEHKLQEATLNNEQTSVLLALAMSSILPVSNVQALNQPQQIETSMLITLNDDLKNQIGAPIPLPDQVGAHAIITFAQASDPIIVEITSLSVNDFPLPDSLCSQIEVAIQQVFDNNGFDVIDPQQDQLYVKGNIPSKYE